MKDVMVVIAYYPLSDTFDVQLQGHEKNPNYFNCVSDGFDTYQYAYDAAKTLERAIKLLGHKVECVNEVSAADYGDSYCDHMAFERLKCMKRGRL